MKKIALILCLVLVASFVLSGCNNSDSIITLEDREVGKIEIQSGNTGEGEFVSIRGTNSH